MDTVALQELLASCFSPLEFQILMEQNPTVCDAFTAGVLPHETTRASQWFSDAVSYLGRHGAIDEAFFTFLVMHRPRRRDDIDRVAQRWRPPERALRQAAGGLAPRRNPFVPYAPFVGRHDQRDRMECLLRDGQSTLLIGGRRTGKTTLVHELRPDVLGRQLLRTDAEGWSLRDGEDAAIRGLGAALGHPLADKKALEVRLCELPPLTVVIDEADKLLGFGWSGQLLAWLRYLDDHLLRERVSFLLVGGPRLARYENPDDRGSPPLNTSRPIYVEPLPVEARDTLVKMLPDPAIDTDELYQEVGGHPWLLTRTLGEIFDGRSLPGALNTVYEAEQNNFIVWRRELGESGLGLLKRIADEGNIEPGAFGYKGRLKRFVREWSVLRALCLVEIDDTGARLGSKLLTQWLLETA